MANIDIKTWDSSISWFTRLNYVGYCTIYYKDFMNGIETGYVNKETGAVSQNTNECHTDYLTVAGSNIGVYNTYDQTTTLSSFCFYDANKKFITGKNYTAKGWVYAPIPANARYVRISGLYSNRYGIRFVLYK